MQRAAQRCAEVHGGVWRCAEGVWRCTEVSEEVCRGVCGGAWRCAEGCAEVHRVVCRGAWRGAWRGVTPIN